jgi:uncharacterized protein (TIGR00304 family)
LGVHGELTRLSSADSFNFLLSLGVLAIFIKKEGTSSMVHSTSELSLLITMGIALVVVGIILIVGALIRASMGSKKGGSSQVSGTGVIMIGPIPIVFGTDKKSVKTVLALALSVVVLITFVVYYWLLR